MAQLDSAQSPWTPAQSRDQLAAVAWLRWRIFVNSFRYRNKKRSATGLAMLILLRIVAWCFIACFFIVPIAGCGALGYFAIAHHHYSLIATLAWTVFTASLFISINISPATLGFDLTPLLRFPIDFPRYLIIRLFFGFFTIPVVVANLSLAAAAIGIGIASHVLFPWAALVLAVFAMHNVFFIRMVFAWVDRWMATRRAREIFGGLVIALSLGFQLAVSGGGRHTASRFAALSRITAPIHPFMTYLPPSLAANAILNHAHAAFAPAYADLLGIFAFGLLFLFIFSLRLRKEFRGENLSEANRRTVRVEPRVSLPNAPTPILSTETILPAVETPHGNALRLPPTIAACLEKEWIYLRRSGAQLYGLITPLVFVFILTRRGSLFGNTAMLLPYAVAYTIFGLLAGLYNVLGADGPGFNLYMLAPIRLRDVILTKNLVTGSIIVLEILLACTAVTLIAGAIPPPAMLAATLAWAAFALLTNMTIGNLRSVFAPMRFEPGKMRRTPTAKGSGFISLGVLFGTLAAGLPVIYYSHKFGQLWLATPLFLVLAAAAAAAYIIVLGRIDTIAADRREDMAEALCKT
jgi:ABC-2 type transport system permease protein